MVALKPTTGIPAMRILLFLLTNAAVLVLISIVFNVLGLGQLLAQQGVDLDLNSLLVFSAVIGMSGSFISLLMSKWMAKQSMGVFVVEQPSNSTESWLVDTIARQAGQLGLGMPEVGIFDSPEPNAFATGASKNSSLVAVSTGLLRGMDRREVEAVLGHEIGHVANGDMVTLTLIQGVVNTFVLFFSRVIGHFVDRVILRNEDGPGIGYFVSVVILDILFGILATMIVAWFSRRREFRADAAGASLEGKGAMIAALERLRAGHEASTLPKQIAAFGISGGIGKLFASHPPLEQRIAALRAGSAVVG